MESITYGIVLQEKTVKAFEPGSIVEVSVEGVGKAIRECVDEIESLRQQLADCEVKWNDASDCCAKGTALLAESQIELAERDDLIATFERQAIESQAREKEAIRKMHEAADAHVQFIQIDHPAAIDSAIRKAKRGALLRAAAWFEDMESPWAGNHLRRMADELK